MTKRKQSHGRGAHPPRRPLETDREDTVWLYGFHAVAAALANPNRPCRHLFATTAAAGSDALAPLLERDGLIVETARRDDIDARLAPGAVHQGVALLCDPLPEADLDEALARPGPIVVLDQATDPRNVGAVMRSAAALGAAALIVPRRHGPPASGALAKAASGALETLPLVRIGNLARMLARLQEAGYWCIGFAADAERTLDEVNFKGKTALVLGAEGTGLRRLTREACDDMVSIPMAAGGLERAALPGDIANTGMSESIEPARLPGDASLNLSAAAAIVLYAAIRGAAD